MSLKRFLITSFVVTISTGIVGGETYNIHRGWNLLGALCNISVENLNDTRIISVWKWNGNRWEAYSPIAAVQQALSNMHIERLNSIEFKKGFWINSRADFTLNLCNNTTPNGSNRINWLVLIYIGADNNLASFADRDIDEMAEVHYPSSVKVVALVDKPSGSYIYGTDNEGNFRLLETFENNVNTGSGETLIDFVRDYYNRFRPQKLALIIWDHGDPWRAIRNIRIEKVVAIDESSRDYLHLSELRGALDFLRRQGVHFNLIGFDECLTGSIETANAVKDFTEYIVASELTEPGDGWYYTYFLNRLAQNPNISAEQLGKAIVDGYVYYYQNIRETVTLAMYKSQQISQLVNALNSLSNELMHTNINIIRNARNDISEVYPNVQSIDLYTFARTLENYVNGVCIPEAQNCPYPLISLDPLRNIVNIINSFYFKTNHSDNRIKGISIYFPVSSITLDRCYFSSPSNPCRDINGEVFWNTFYNSSWVRFLKYYFDY